MAVGDKAKLIALSINADKKNMDDIVIAGMLHEVGKLILACKSPKEYEQILESANEEGDAVCAIEKEFLGTSHAEIGAYLPGSCAVSDGLAVVCRCFQQPGNGLAKNSLLAANLRISGRYAKIFDVDRNNFCR